MPVPRRAQSELPRAAATRLLPLLRLRRVRRRLLLPPEDGPRLVLGGGRTARGAPRLRAQLRGRWRPVAGPRQSRATARREPGCGGVLRRAARFARGRRGSTLPRRARLRRRGGEAVRRRIRAEELGQADEPPEGPRLLARGAGRRRARLAGRPRRVRPVPRAPGVADPGCHRPGRRLRRAPPAGGRQRAEVPEHPRDGRVPQGAGAVRARPRQARHLAHQAGRRRRGVHRRHGVPPRGRDDRDRDVRHRVRRRAHPGAAAGARRRHRRRRGRVHVRRRRGRAAGRDARVRRGAAVHRADLRRGRARRPRPVRSAPGEGRPRRASTDRREDAAVRVRHPPHGVAIRPRVGRGPSRRASRRGSGHRRDPRPVVASRLHARAGADAGARARRGRARGPRCGRPRARRRS